MPNPTPTIFIPYHAFDDLHRLGTRALQPAAPDVTPGTLYCVTDEGNKVERSSGLTWQAYSPSGGGGAPSAHAPTHVYDGADPITGELHLSGVTANWGYFPDTLETGVLTATSLGATPLNAANLTGTVADARLSANVALENVANVFSALQTVNAGLAFPAVQVPSAAVNTLDDYREDAWTPTLLGASGSGVTYGGRVGRYVKIGQFVFVTCYITLTSKGTLAGQISIGGLPVPAHNVVDGYAGGPVLQWNNFATTWVNVWGLILPASTSIILRGATAATVGNFTGVQATDLTNTTTFLTTFMYLAN